MRTHAERDAEIYAKRKAGKTLRDLAAEYDLSRESIRRIECQEWRREQNPDRVAERMKNGMLSAVARITRDERYTEFLAALKNDPKRAAEQVAALGRSTFERAPNIGKKTLIAIEAWIGKYGYRWR